MSTPAQIAANRRNAKLSTGPKTRRGKAKVSANALKHGLLARGLLLPGDDVRTARALEEFAEGVRCKLNPVDELETELVERVIAGLWRLRRLNQVEAGLFASCLLDDKINEAGLRARLASKGETWRNDLERRHAPLVAAGTVQVQHTRWYGVALQGARAAELKAATRVPRLGHAFVAREGTFSNLSRYEAGIERSVYKALHELERLQRARGGEYVPAPAAVDANVDVNINLGEARAKVDETNPKVNNGDAPPVDEDFEFEDS